MNKRKMIAYLNNIVESASIRMTWGKKGVYLNGIDIPDFSITTEPQRNSADMIVSKADLLRSLEGSMYNNTRIYCIPGPSAVTVAIGSNKKSIEAVNLDGNPNIAFSINSSELLELGDMLITIAAMPAAHHKRALPIMFNMHDSTVQASNYGVLLMVELDSLSCEYCQSSKQVGIDRHSLAKILQLITDNGDETDDIFFVCMPHNMVQICVGNRVIEVPYTSEAYPTITAILEANVEKQLATYVVNAQELAPYASGPYMLYIEIGEDEDFFYTNTVEGYVDIAYTTMTFAETIRTPIAFPLGTIASLSTMEATDVNISLSVYRSVFAGGSLIIGKSGTTTFAVINTAEDIHINQLEKER